MHCIDTQPRSGTIAWSCGVGVACLLLGACSTRTAEQAPASTATPAPVVVATPSPNTTTTTDPASPTSPTPAAPRAATPPAAPPQTLARPKLGPPSPSRNWNEFKLQAARRLVAANPAITYLGPVPEPLLAIPVLEVELNADGSVRRVQVLRHPTQAKDTTQMAIDAVHRAAPYGDVSRLPKPWKWAEVFLFDDDRRFKPRTLDL